MSSNDNGDDNVVSFARHPPTIGEIRSEKSGVGSDWTVRDALISLLRDIDAGVLKAEKMVACITYEPPNGRANLAPDSFGYLTVNCCANTLEAFGLVLVLQQGLMEE